MEMFALIVIACTTTLTAIAAVAVLVDMYGNHKDKALQ